MQYQNQEAVSRRGVEGAVSANPTRSLDLYDEDGDGTLSPLEKICQKYDTDNDGTFSIKEVESIVEDMQEAQKQAKNMGRLACAIFLVMLGLCGALIGLMYGANEASKEQHVSGAVQVDLANKPTQTKTLSAIAQLSGMNRFEAATLNQVKYLSFRAKQTSPSTGDEFDFHIVTTGWKRTPDKNKLYVYGKQGTYTSIHQQGPSNLPTMIYQENGATIGSTNNTYEVVEIGGPRHLSEHVFETGEIHFYPDMAGMRAHVHRHTGRRLEEDEAVNGVAAEVMPSVTDGTSVISPPTTAPTPYPPIFTTAPTAAPTIAPTGPPTKAATHLNTMEVSMGGLTKATFDAVAQGIFLEALAEVDTDNLVGHVNNQLSVEESTVADVTALTVGGKEIDESGITFTVVIGSTQEKRAKKVNAVLVIFTMPYMCMKSADKCPTAAKVLTNMQPKFANAKRAILATSAIEFSNAKMKPAP